MKERILALAATGVLFVSLLSGCATTTPPENVSSVVEAPASSALASSAPSEPVKLTLWHSMSDDTGVLMDKLIADFNNKEGKEKGIEIEGVFQGAYSDSTTKLRTILQNDQVDQLPDIMQIDATGIVDYQGSKYKYTVDDALKVDTAYDISRILTVPLVNWKYNNVQLGMPFSSSTTVLYYNKTMLDSAGISTAPTTFQEIIDASAKLPKQTADGAAISAYASVPDSPSLANWIGQMKGKDANASYIVDNKNGRSANATKLVCDSEGTLAAFLTEWKKMYDSKAVLNKSDALSDMFLAGQLAFYTTSSSNLNTLLTKINGTFELGCAYLPRVSEQSNYGATVSGSGLFMFSKGDAKKTAAAWEFVKYMVSSEVQASFSTGTGYFPANKASYETETYTDYVAKYPQLEIGVKQVTETSPDMLGITVGPSWDFYMEIQNQVSTMLDQGKSVDETVASMTTTLNGLLEQYNKANS